MLIWGAKSTTHVEGQPREQPKHCQEGIWHLASAPTLCRCNALDVVNCYSHPLERTHEYHSATTDKRNNYTARRACTGWQAVTSTLHKCDRLMVLIHLSKASGTKGAASGLVNHLRPVKLQQQGGSEPPAALQDCCQLVSNKHGLAF